MRIKFFIANKVHDVKRGRGVGPALSVTMTLIFSKNGLDMPPNKILLPFHLIVRIFILSLKRIFLLSGSQLTRLYCTSGLSLETKESWQLCIMSSNIF